MKRLFFLIAVEMLLGVTQVGAQMSTYCSVPPSVARAIAPNILIVMDTSKEMVNGPAHQTLSTTPDGNDEDGDGDTAEFLDVYNPAEETNYIGYFKPGACYKSSGTKFEEVLNTSVIPNRSYAASDSCPTTAPFRGGLMNWATMSMYDIMQKAMIGGDSVSKQGNAHTLLGTANSWVTAPNNAFVRPKVYGGCVFARNGADNFDIRDGKTAPGRCSLLNSSPVAIANAAPPANSPLQTLFAYASARFDRLSTWMRHSIMVTKIEEQVRTLTEWVQASDWVPLAWGSHTLEIAVTGGTLIPPSTYTFTGTVGVPLLPKINLTCGGDCPNGTYGWTFTGIPSWLTLVETNDGGKKKRDAALSGTPTAAGTYTFTAVLALPGHTTSSPTTIVINVAAPTPTPTPGPTPTPTPTPDPSVSRSKSFNVRVDLLEENFNDYNDNDIWDPGEPFDLADDLNGNGVWDGKGGIVQKFSDEFNPKARWGVLTLNTTGGGGSAFKFASPGCIPASPLAPFYTEIQNAHVDDGAGIVRAVSAGIHYYGKAAGGTNQIASPPSLPGGETYTGCSGAPIDAAIPCRKNFMLVLTSGNLGPSVDKNGDSIVFDVSNDSECSTTAHDLVKLSCFGKNHDLRSDVSNDQNLTTFYVNTMGPIVSSIPIMEEAARAGGSKKMYGGGKPVDLAAGIENAISDILADAASGTAVSVLTTSSRHVSSLLQAYFFPARQYGTQVVSWTGYLQNLWVDPRGDMREDRRDTVGGHDFQLKLEEDQVAKLYFDPVAKAAGVGLFSTLADGTGGDLAACKPTGTTQFTQLASLMEAGEKLALTSPNDRKIFTSKIVRHGSTSTTLNCTTLDCFTSGGISGTLETALNADLVYTKDKIISYVRGECLESGVSGNVPCSTTGLDPLFRDRRVPVGGVQSVWKLGDMINSTPKQIGNTPQNAYINEYGDSTYYEYVTSAAYKNRSSIAVVGANDGMLHAFRVGYLKDRGLTGMKALYENTIGSGATDKIGEEVWGYIPFNAFPYLKYLADPDYCHIYYNDLPVRLVDASIGSGPTDTKTVSDWRTILIGGMRYGGACEGGFPTPPIAGVGFSSYYAIDVTDPENPKPLWEFSDTDMGYATTTPAILRTGPSGENGRWYVAIGSGSTQLPDSQTDIGRTTTGYLYLLDMETGERVQKISLGHNAIVGGLLPVDIERDYKSEKIYFGTSYTAGVPALWKGKLMSLSIPNSDLSGASAADFKLSSLFEGDHPISAAPEAARYDTQAVWVYAGSGKYNSEVDETNLSNQIFIGMKDPPTSFPLPITDMDNQTGIAVTGTVKSTKKACVYDAAATPPAFAEKDIVTEIVPTSTPIPPSAKGWYITLTGGRRVITRPVSVGGLVDFLTYTPSPNLCDFGGSSNAYAVLYDKGVAPAAVALRSPGITSGSSGSVTVYNNVDLGTGAPPAGEGIILLPPKEGDDVYKQKIQLGTTAIVEGEVKPDISLFTTVMHWLRR